MSDIPIRQPQQILVPSGGMHCFARDMTVTVAADVPLRRVQEELAGVNQWLPVDGNPALPVGRLVETNSTGPLRLGYGAWRDLLLGCQFCNGRADLVTAGGRTVKNVAGYDLARFMVGHGGLFGTLVTITTRTWRRPAGAMLAAFDPEPAIVAHLLPTPLRPQWAMLTPGALFCGYLADERTLAYYEAALPGEHPASVARRTLQEDIDHRAGLWSMEHDSLIAFRASVPPARLGEFVRGLSLSWAADPAFGIVVGLCGDPAAVRRAAEAVNGSAWFYNRAGVPVDVALTADQEAIVARLRQAFGPEEPASA